MVRLKQLQAEREASADAALVPVTPPPNAAPDDGNKPRRRVEGDATSRALALIQKALKYKPAAGASQSDAEAKDEMKGSQSVKVSQPANQPSQEPQSRRGAAAKAVKGPILL